MNNKRTDDEEHPWDDIGIGGVLLGMFLFGAIIGLFILIIS